MWELTTLLATLLLAPGLPGQTGVPTAPTAPASSTTDGVRVEQLVTDALARNADLLATRQRVAEAQGLLRQAGFRPNPGLEITYGTGSLLGSAGERQLTTGYNHLFELGGKRQRRVEVSQIGVDLGRLEVAERERQLRADVSSRFAEALAAQRNLETAERLLELTGRTLQVTEARVKEGEAAPLERGLIQVELSRLQSDRTLFASQAERAVLALKPLAGLSLDAPLQVAGDLRVGPPLLVLPELLERALATRPDLLAARREVALREAELRLTQAEAVPNVIASGQYTRVDSLAGQFGLTSGQPGPVTAPIPIQNTDNLATVGLSITLPVRGRNQGNIQAARARLEAGRQRQRFVEQVVAQEVRAAFNRFEATRQALAIYDERVLGQAQDNLRIIRAAYDAGELRLFDVVNEQRRLVDTQRAYTEVLREGAVAVIELERAVGAPLR